MHNSQYMNTEERTGIHDNALLIAEKIISIRGSQSETKMRCGEGGDTALWAWMVVFSKSVVLTLRR